MAKYIKKPIEVEAWQFTGSLDGRPDWLRDDRKVIVYFDDPGAYDAAKWGIKPRLDIKTLEGTMTASIGDYIIRGVQGEIYPCKPDIFEATYDPA